MQAKFFIQLKIKVGNLLQTQVRELSIPIEILHPYFPNKQQMKMKREINNCQLSLLSQRNVYPKPKFPP